LQIVASRALESVCGWIWFRPVRPVLRAPILAICLGVMAAAAADDSALRPAAGALQDKRLSFDIPAQALHEALFAYTDATGLNVLVDDTVASGRRSAPVRGSFTPEDALRTLLSETGLEFQYTAANAFTLVPASPIHQTLRDSSRDEAYFRVVQTAVKHTLCSRGDTLPGDYRMVAQLWIGLSGTVLRAALLGSTGHDQRDRRLGEMLQRLSVGEAPPPGLPQPVTLVVLPRPPRTTDDCAGADRDPLTGARQ
jgi:Secretin and TonB N terminus short domain